MTIAVIRFRTFILVVGTVIATLFPSKSHCPFTTDCLAAEDPGSNCSQAGLKKNLLELGNCCSLWEINTRCLPSGTCLASCNQELATYRFEGPCWTASSEAALRLEIEEHAAWTILFVHGNRTSIDSARRYAIDLLDQLKRRSTVPVRLICLSWPSEKPRQAALPSALVQHKKELIRETGFQLVHFMNRCPDESLQSMVGFSFGCSIIGCALHLNSGGEVDGCSLRNQPFEQHRSPDGSVPQFRLGFIAPAMDRCALQPSGEYCCALNSVVKLVNLYNSRDPVLRRFRFFDRENPVAAGYAGLMDTQFQPLAQNSLLLQFDCRSIGATHALRDYGRCSAYEQLLDNILGNDHPEIARIPILAGQ